jgi:hypothetical protein
MLMYAPIPFDEAQEGVFVFPDKVCRYSEGRITEPDNSIWDLDLWLAAHDYRLPDLDWHPAVQQPSRERPGA